MEKMTLYLAVAIAEGFHEGEDVSEEKWAQRQIEAWQFLHNSGSAYKLQGWYGRTARDLINEGIIKE